MSTIDEILWLLKDGEWHSLKEVAEKVALPQTKAEIAAQFLEEYGFIESSEDSKKVKLQPSILNFIEEIQRLEQEETSSQ